jgi:diguanylate cyclase (GGDEF)-like protein
LIQFQNKALIQHMNSTRPEKPYYSFFVRYIWLISALWTFVIGGSLFWNITHLKQNTLKIARIHAQISYEKDVSYRRWNSIHGGVYVPATKDTPPNPYLSHVSERDIKTPSGKILTLMNPAYMTRQVNELIKKEQGIGGHITSLKPLRPENSPDSWEKKALEEFEQGKDMVMSVENIEGKNYFRIMHPFITEERCLKCHEAQGYKVGDIRGGISVSIPMAPLYAIQQERINALAIVHTVLWFLGISGLLFTRQRLKASEQKEHKLVAELQALSITDELTGLYNRRGILSMATQQYSIAKRIQKTLMLVYIDLDDLKQINDTYGHQEGDNALIDTANILRNTFRETDIIVRTGGDEFAVFGMVTGDKGLNIITSLINEELEKHVEEYTARSIKPYRLSLSSGIAFADPEKPFSFDSMLSEADQNMYLQKQKKQGSEG